MEAIPPTDGESVQRILDIDGQDVTAGHVRAARDEFRRAVTTALAGLAAAAHDQTDAGPALKACLDAWHQYFQSLKGGVNYSEEDVRALAAAEERRQQQFYLCLRELARSFVHEGVRFDILPPGGVYAELAWQAPLVFGTFIRSDNAACLYAAPPVTWATTEYLSPHQAVPAARVLAATPEYVLFLPANQDPGQAFFDAYHTVFGRHHEVTLDVPGARHVDAFPGILFIDTDDTYSAVKIEALRKLFGLPAILVGSTASYAATLYLPEEPAYTRLFTELGPEGTA